MGGGHDQRAALGEGLEDRPGQRRALVGIGPGAELVDEHQRAGVGLGQHLADLLHERRERRQILGDRLLVADDRVQRLEHRQPRPLRRRQVTADLGHERKERQRLERDRLAAGVGAGDQQQRPVGRELEVDRHHGALGVAPRLGEQQRMPRLAQGDAARAIDGGRRGGHALGRVRAREHPVELANRRHVGVQLQAAGAHGGRQLGQDPGGLLLLLALGLHEVVVGLDEALRLHEDRLATLRAIVHDAAHPLPRLGSHRQDVAAVADGHEAVGEEPIALRLEQALELADDAAAPVADLLAELAKARAGPVGERAVVLERVAERVAELGESRELAGAPADLARHGLHRAAPRGQAWCRVEGGDQQCELGAVQHAAVGFAAREHGADVGDAVERRRALAAERQARLSGER